MSKISLNLLSTFVHHIEDETFFNELIDFTLATKKGDLEELYYLRAISYDLLFKNIRDLSNNDGIFLGKYIILKKCDEDEIKRHIQNVINETTVLTVSDAFAVFRRTFIHEDELYWQ